MLIAGTGGLGKEILGILIQDGFTGDIIFYDEDRSVPDLLYDKYQVLKDINSVRKYFLSIEKQFIVGIGHPRLREKLALKMEKAGGEFISVISKRASVFQFNEEYSGAIIQQGVGISHQVKMGKGVAVHINASIGHSADIGDYVNIGPCATVVGPVQIGDHSYISAHAVIFPHLKIGNHVLVTAGKTVDHDLEDNMTF